MNIYCPKCGENIQSTDQSEPLPSACPECGADLYSEEIIYNYLISDSSADVVIA